MTSPNSSSYQPIAKDDDMWMSNIDSRSVDIADSKTEQQPGSSGSDSHPPARTEIPNNTIEACHPKGFTTWTYNPVWPMRGTKQRALGPIASSRQIALEVMRRAFPTLSDIPDDSIKFEILPGADMAFQLPCITILDDVWESLATGPAKAILVSVRESPDKADLRIAHERNEWYSSVIKSTGGVFVGSFVIICFILWLRRMSSA